MPPPSGTNQRFLQELDQYWIQYDDSSQGGLRMEKGAEWDDQGERRRVEGTAERGRAERVRETDMKYYTAIYRVSRLYKVLHDICYSTTNI